MYQSSEGGKTYVPLEDRARIIGASTPRLGKLVQSKYVEGGAGWVVSDLAEDRSLKLSRHFVQDLSESVSKVMIDKQMSWSYALPESIDEAQIQSVSISRDGTTTHIIDQGWRETMCGSIMLNDAQGSPLHCIYVGAGPEYGKFSFDASLNREIELLSRQLPKVAYLDWQGLADGAADNWAYLHAHTDLQTLDFYHASEHLSAFAKLAIRSVHKREVWVSEQLEQWQEQPDGVHKTLEQLPDMVKAIRGQKKQEDATEHLTYFNNQAERMNYYEARQKGFPIGSGTIEAACKHLVKQRLGQSGMRWKIPGADRVLVARSLKRTAGRWEQFWDKISRYGLN